MQLSTYTIDNILTSAGDIRLEGRYKGEPTSIKRQVIVRKGKAITDLAMKQGQGGWELEILLPPLSYAVFAALAGNTPTECLFDRSVQASQFEIGYAYGNGTRTATTTFSIT